MTVTVKKRSSLTVPAEVQHRAGIKAGDRLEFRVSGGIINIIPELPSADDEYTPQQRRIIDTKLAEAEKGPHYGPFKTANAAIRFLNKEIRTRNAGKRKAPKR
jgi:AbrB family looped-hinge helix DNA binding protein